MSKIRILTVLIAGYSVVALAGCGIDSKVARVNKAPDVDITEPLAEAVLRQGVGGMLQAVVSDSDDQPRDLAIVWSIDGASPTPITADADGLLSAVLPELEIGDHVLDIAVTDLDEATGTASVNFSVQGPLGAPNVVITAPEDGTSVAIGTTMTFTGEANDSATPAADLVFAWSSDVDGALPGAISGGGQSALLTDALSAGEHLISLVATDLDGEIGTDTLTVTITDEPAEAEPGELIFTEVMVNPNAVEDQYGEYVELYNTGGRTLDLANYSFHDDGGDVWVFDASVTVPGYSYLMICANTDLTVNGGVPCDTWFYRNPLGTEPPSGQGHGQGMAIANNDDELALTSPAGIDIDVFNYNDTSTDAIEAGVAFGLDPNKLDGVSNDDFANWCSQTTVPSGMIDAGTPGSTNDSCDGM